jgi:DNA-binding MarR family transcriptional regulator
MADIKFDVPVSPLREEDLWHSRELLFFAYRDYMSEPGQILQKYEFGFAHHRVVHFVGRRPGMTVSELLDTLKITKQSLSRVLSALIEQGYIRQEKGAQDKRQRLLFLTDKGVRLEGEVSAPQQARVAKAFAAAGLEAAQGFCKVLAAMVDDDGSDLIASFLSRR